MIIPVESNKSYAVVESISDTHLQTNPSYGTATTRSKDNASAQAFSLPGRYRVSISFKPPLKTRHHQRAYFPAARGSSRTLCDPYRRYHCNHTGIRSKVGNGPDKGQGPRLRNYVHQEKALCWQNPRGRNLPSSFFCDNTLPKPWRLARYNFCLKFG